MLTLVGECRGTFQKQGQDGKQQESAVLEYQGQGGQIMTRTLKNKSGFALQMEKGKQYTCQVDVGVFEGRMYWQILKVISNGNGGRGKNEVGGIGDRAGATPNV